jgi:hypothetical protein
MAQCEKLLMCPFFNDKMKSTPKVAELMKQTYCLDDKTHCARYQVSSAGIPAPLDLFPNDTERAHQLLHPQA